MVKLGLSARARRIRTLAIGAVALGAVGVSAFAAGLIGSGEAKGSSEAKGSGAQRVASALVVDAVPARFESGYLERRAHVGRAEPGRISRVGGELGGLVVELAVDEGDEVGRGDVIARFDVERLLARRVQLEADRRRQGAMLAELRTGPREEDIATQRANVDRLESAAALADATAKRVRTAFDADAVSSQEWDEARLRAEQARAALTAARADLRELEAGTRRERVDAQAAAVDALDAAIRSIEVDVAKASVRAPFDAVVSERLVDEGEVLAPGAPLFELRERSEVEAYEIRVGVLPEIAERLQREGSVEVRFRGHSVSARVLAVRRDRTYSTRTVAVRLELGPTVDDEVRLRDGELVEVGFERRVELAGVWLPISALSQGPRGLWRCFVLEPIDGERVRGATHRVAPRTLEVVHFDAGNGYVRGALGPGELVVRVGTHRLVPGLAVRMRVTGGQQR